MASIFRLLMSFSVSSRLPRSLQDFHFSSLFLDILNFSVLLSFTFRFLFWRMLGTVALMLLMRCIAVEAHVISSPVCFPTFTFSLTSLITTDLLVSDLLVLVFFHGLGRGVKIPSFISFGCFPVSAMVLSSVAIP